MTRDQTRDWVDAYVGAWESNDETAIRSLFATNATYRTSPFAEPWEGQDAIAARWVARGDKPGDWTFRYQVLAETPDVGIVRGWTAYRQPRRVYSNMWVIEFDSHGRATSFTEWWMQDTSGQESSPG
jgi:hypothetical protein